MSGLRILFVTHAYPRFAEDGAGSFLRAQAIVMPARNEGLGLVAVEAQLCRTPVITYRSGGLPDVVNPEWGGILVTPGDTRALAEAMVRVDGERGAVSGYGAAARAKMLDRFAPSAVAAPIASCTEPC